MSCIYKGTIIDTEQSRSAMGGTEQMRNRLLDYVNSDLLNQVAIHFSRVRTIYQDVPNIFYAHDLAEDPENNILFNDGWKNFKKIIFVTNWQKDTYIKRFELPSEMCIVIENAIEPAYYAQKTSDKIKLIYHTTPHRGLALLVPVFEALAKRPEFKDRVHLDVFSSFEIYGWKQRDANFESLFERLQKHPNATYHGTQPNSVVRDYLSRAHYFPYPCIWKETSCIALIEAIGHKVVAVHPDYGALGETAGTNTVMYDWVDNQQKHAEIFYNIMVTILRENLQSFKQINSNQNHNIDTFTNKWTTLLEKIT